MTRRAAVQAGRLGVEDVARDALRLGPGQYRAALEVSGLSFGLLDEEEQESLLTRYAHWLQALSYPLQFLVRVLPLDLQRHLDILEGRARRQRSPFLATLTRDHMTFMQGLARERALLERHLYVVVPSGDDHAGPVALLGRRGVVASPAAALAQLAARCDDVTAGLRACRLAARRLEDDELLNLVYACWCPERARLQPLSAAHLAAQLLVRGSHSRERTL